MRNSSSVRRCGWSVAALTLSCVALPGLALAQEAPAHIAYADTVASIERENETIDAIAGEPLVPGDRLRTGSGRAEVWLPDGSILDLDVDSTAEWQSSTVIRLSSGRALVVVTRSPDDGRSQPYRIDTPFASVIVDGPGEYRVSLARTTDAYVELAVISGSAELQADGGSMIVGGGERSVARPDSAPTPPQTFSANRLDAFGAWAASQRGDPDRAASTRYLPSNLQMYGGTFDRYGSWDYEPAYGYVWYPSVDPNWRPYYEGSWRPLPSYGWTWAGGGSWGWPTHHYGRWGHGRARWFWIPERRWAPAWVSWASAADYVSWCPLGFDNRPVFGFSLAAGSTWAGWTVMPRTSFGGRHAYVNRYAVEGRRLPRNTPFAMHRDAPIGPPHSRSGTDARPGRIPAAASGVATPRYPQRRDTPYDNPRTRDTRTPGGIRNSPAAGADRVRAYRRNPGAVPGNASGTDRPQPPTATPRAMPRYQDSRPLPTQNRDARPTRPDAASAQYRDARPRRPDAVSPQYRDARPRRPDAASPQSSAYRQRRDITAPGGASTPQAAPVQRAQAPGVRSRSQNDGRPRTASTPSPAPDARPQPRAERRASAPPRESAPRTRPAERATPRSETRSGSGDRPAGAGGHGRRRP